MLIEDMNQAAEEKGPFEFTTIRYTADWYINEKVSVEYNEYNYLSLEKRYGGTWYLVGHRINKYTEQWEAVNLGEILKKDIPRLVDWARYVNRYGHVISILTEVKAIDGELNVIDDFIKIMGRSRC